MLFP
jgi:hypothetical protein